MSLIVNEVCKTKMPHCIFAAEHCPIWWGEEDLLDTHGAMQPLSAYFGGRNTTPLSDRSWKFPGRDEEAFPSEAATLCHHPGRSSPQSL